MNTGVHQTHCCIKHGCKYGDEDCPVVTGLILQRYPCEDCSNPTIEESLKQLFDSHRSKSKICCDETCFCWDVEELV